MKILTIQATYFPMIGGAEVFHQKTAEWLVRNDHQVDVVTCIWDKPDIAWSKWQNQEEVINKVKIYRVKPWFYSQYFKSFGAIWPLYQKAVQLAKTRGYDLIHAHIFPALIVGALLKKKTALPLITTIQGGDVADYSETGSKLGLILKPIISWSLKKANLVHTVSTHMENSVKKLGIKNTKVIPNGVDTLLFRPRNKKKLRTKYEIPNTKYVIISHSRLTPKNGLDILIKAIEKLPNKNKILVLLVGGGEQENELKRLTREQEISEMVRFFGYKSREETAELLSLSDLFVRPSREEGFGIAFLEAMATGLPVIGTKTGGIMDFVCQRKTGLLVKVDDITELTAAINKVMDDKLLAKQLGTTGAIFADTRYAWFKICQQLEDQYISLISNR